MAALNLVFVAENAHARRTAPVVQQRLPPAAPLGQHRHQRALAARHRAGHCGGRGAAGGPGRGKRVGSLFRPYKLRLLLQQPPLLLVYWTT